MDALSSWSTATTAASKEHCLWLDDDCRSMPWDEASDDQHFPQQDKPMDEALSERWRRIGQARRQFLLDNDRRQGGTHFEIKKTHSIRNYFEIANRVRPVVIVMYSLKSIRVIDS